MKTVAEIATEANRSRSRVTVVIDNLGITKQYRKDKSKPIIVITDEESIRVLGYFSHTKAQEKKQVKNKFTAGVNAMFNRDMGSVLSSSWNIRA